jgi:hypothetical protein
MMAWLLLNGPKSLDSSIIPDISLPWLAFITRYHTKSSALVACNKGYAIRLNTLLNGLPVRHTINYQKEGFELNILTDDCFVFTTDRPWNSVRNKDHFVDLIVSEGLHSGKKVTSISRLVVHYNTYRDKRAPRGKLSTEDYGPKKNMILEQQKKGWLVASEPNCPPKEFAIINWPKVKAPSSIYELNSKQRYFSEHFFPEGSYFQAISKPWLLDELWQEHFGKDWIPFALEDRIAKFPEAAKFFKERYPQVVPEEAWALLGGKPA